MIGNSLQTLFLRLLPFLLVAVLAAVLIAVWYEPAPQVATLSQKSDYASPSGAWHFTAAAAAPGIMESAVESPPPPARSPVAISLSASSRRLVDEYLATQDISARMSILHDLADDARSGRAAFIELFSKENDDTLKTLILNLSAATGEPDPDLFTLLEHAVAKGEPGDVRDTAQDILISTADPRAIPVWQSLLNDDNPDVRQTAADQIAQLRDASP
ncbi:MAG TPA: HEAT repeat domain-containing protein [Chthoniobacteraceae bacterium]|jgi:hypothetical protein|nr:HEAT repeat domain-containing protein [Chthoniobacteraceae bacterium]